MRQLTNRERFLAGHKFTYQGESETIFEGHKMSGEAVPGAVFSDGRIEKGRCVVFMGCVKSYTKDTVIMQHWIFNKLVNYRISFAKMIFIESEVTV